jgi:uncharacterized protein (TIGR02186 family)
VRAPALALAIAVAAPAAGEEIVAGLSHSRVSITADFSGEEILVYGAVRREAPPPEAPPLDVVITVEGPSAPVIVRRKARVFGIWVNREAVTIDAAPTFYAIAATGPVEEALSQTEDLRHDVTIGRAIRAVGIAGEAREAALFLEALVRLNTAAGRYSAGRETVRLTEETLFRADVALPANLTEGDYTVRMFLTRGGKVIDRQEQVIFVRKEGIERWIFNLAHQRPLAYGLLSLAIAAAAGWGAAAAFQLLRR